MTNCRIFPIGPRPDPGVVDQLRKFPSCVVSDQLTLPCSPRGVRQLTSANLGIMAGPALTVRTRPGDNLVMYKAVEISSPGDVLVVDAGGGLDRAVMGELFYNYMISKGIAGIVIDGAIRDHREVSLGTMPVFARGSSHPRPSRVGPGEIHGAISLAGSVVRDGDLLVGDLDGIVFLNPGQTSRVIEGCLRTLEDEEVKLPLAIAGDLDTSWIDDVLDIDHVGREA